MRGLLPPPHGTARIVLEIDVDGRACSTGFWCLVPGGTTGDVAGAEAIADAVLLGPAHHVADLMSRAASIVACDVTIYSLAFARARVQVEPIPGAWPGAQAVAVACGLRWLGDVRGRGTASVQRLPSCPDEFVSDTWRLSASGYANLRDKGVSFLDDFDALPGPYGGTLLLGCVHRIHGGAPANPPTFEPFVSVEPSPHLLTTPRRLPRGHQVSSL